jgi:hypothetical protein
LRCIMNQPFEEPRPVFRRCRKAGRGLLVAALLPALAENPWVVHRYFGPGGHPSTFGAVADAYLAPRSFSSGPEGFSSCVCDPSRRAAAMDPAGTAVSVPPATSDSAAFTKRRVVRLPVRVHEASVAFDTFGPPIRSLAFGQQPGLSGGNAPCLRTQMRLLSFVGLALSTWGLSPHGSHRPSRQIRAIRPSLLALRVC